MVEALGCAAWAYADTPPTDQHGLAYRLFAAGLASDAAAADARWEIGAATIGQLAGVGGSASAVPAERSRLSDACAQVGVHVVAG